MDDEQEKYCFVCRKKIRFWDRSYITEIRKKTTNDLKFADLPPRYYHKKCNIFKKKSE